MIQVSFLLQHHAGPTGDVLVVKNSDGTWSFPCGTVRTNETEAEACERIAWEQLGLKIVVSKLTMQGHKKPADGYVEHLYEGNITHNTHTRCDYHNYYEAVNKWQAEPAEGKCEYCWIHASQLGTLTFVGDDANFMAKYDPWVNARFIPDVRMY